MARGVETLHPHLEPLDRGIDKARGAAGDTFLAEHVPRFERVAELQFDTATGDGAIIREAEFALRFIPDRIEAIAGVAQVREHAEEILPHEVAEHEAVV